jgi:hypothetical protein
MDLARQNEIIAKLTEKGAILPCPRCGRQQFTIIDGYGAPQVQDQMKGFVLGGKTIPSVIVACSNCGWLAFHALGALESLPAEEKTASPNPEPPKERVETT